MTNVEEPRTTKGKTRGNTSIPAHASDPQALQQFLKIKGNIWNLSNNHILDCGKEGLEDTIQLEKRNGCQVLGAGMNDNETINPVVLDRSVGIGMIAVCYKKMFAAGTEKPGVIHWKDCDRIRNVISEIKKDNRWCVRIVHAGEEFSALPMLCVRKQYLQYLKYETDIILLCRKITKRWEKK